MTTATKRLPLIELPIEGHTRSLGTIEVSPAGKKKTLPLQGVDITARVADRVASVAVKQTFKNTYSEHLEAVYIFPLSGGCVVSDFEMRVGSRVVKGVVQERAQARMEYQQAIQAGKRAALLEQDRDDVFTVQLGNVPPNEEITVVLTYSERLPFFESGKTELRLPLVVAPRYIPGQPTNRFPVGDGTELDTSLVPDASRISPPMLASGTPSQVALSISVDLVTTDSSGANTVSELGCSQHASQLGLDDGIVKIELARDDERLNRDFVLQWRFATADVRSSMIVYRDPQGQPYAMLSLVPPKRDGYVGAARDVVFVLDRSGSMQGIKMVSAARACAILLSTLGPNDRFAIQAFDNSPEWLTLPTLPGRAAHWISADEAGIAKGEKFLRSIDARGGTEMDMALSEAFDSVNARPSSDGRVPVVVVLTDGEVGDESRILRRVQTQLGEARLFAIGIDTSVNSGLLRRLANLGGGTSTFVQPGASLEQALRAVGREIGEPMITDIEVVSEGMAIESKTLAPLAIPDLFEGRAITVFMKLSGRGAVKVKGKWSDGKLFEEKVKTRMVPVPAVAQLWAKAMIADLEDSYRLQPSSGIKQQIIDLSTKHSVLTKFTAFVAVDHAEIVNKDGSIRKVVQPVEAPAEWDMLADQANTPMMSLAQQAAPASLPRSGVLFSRLAESKVDQIGSMCDSFSQAQESWGSAPGAAPTPQQAPQPSSMPAPGAPIPGRRPAPTQPPAPTAPPAGPMEKLRMGSKREHECVDTSQKEIEAIRNAHRAFTKFTELLTAAFEAVKSGQVPDCTELEKFRKQLLTTLNQTTVGTQLPLLQKFLRGAAVELVQSVQQKNVTAAGVQPIWERHMQAFERAQADATTQLSTHGAGSGDTFWEASI